MHTYVEISEVARNDLPELQRAFEGLPPSAIAARYEGQAHPEPFTLPEFLWAYQKRIPHEYLVRIALPQVSVPLIAGWGEFYPYDSNTRASLSLLIDPQFQKMELGFQLAQHLIREALRKLGICFFTWGVDETKEKNIASHRLVAKLGQYYGNLFSTLLPDTKVTEYQFLAAPMQYNLPLEYPAAA